jgi:hypothetical protein
MGAVSGKSRSAKALDARDLTVMRRELKAARRSDGSIVERDIRARRHEANAAAQWVKTRVRKRQEVQTDSAQFDEAAYLRDHLGISVSTMEIWIAILRNWDLYVRRRRAAGSSGYSGASYARALIRDEHAEPGMNLKAFQNRSAHSYDRLKNSAARAAHFQALYDGMCRRYGEEPKGPIPPTLVAKLVKPTVRLPFADAYHADCFRIMPSLPSECMIWPSGICPME